ncbi:MAG: GntR family transcriptional regulator [Fibrobacteres bacterium]|nr:GntR family transcriptional regulator [Fibrobacterota bacterium]
MIYIDLYKRLKTDIETGKIKPGHRIPFTTELVATYHISQTTVSKAVKQLEEEGLVRRIKSKGTFVLETGSSALKDLRRKKRIGLLFDGYLWDYMDTHFMVQAYRGMEESAKSNNKNILVLPKGGKTLDEYLHEIQSIGFCGLILHSPYTSSIKPLLRTLKIPLVCLDFIDHSLNVDQITIDHLKAGALAVRALHKESHDKILFLGNFWTEENIPSPHHAYWSSSAATEAKLLHIQKFTPYFLPMANLDILRKKIAEVLMKHEDSNGFICASLTYFQILKDLIERQGFRRKCKTDAVLFSDLREKPTLNGKPIHQCSWNTRDMGVRAMDVLLERLEGGPHRPQTHYLPVSIS